MSHEVFCVLAAFFGGLVVGVVVPWVWVNFVDDGYRWF